MTLKVKELHEREGIWKKDEIEPQEEICDTFSTCKQLCRSHNSQMRLSQKCHKLSARENITYGMDENGDWD